MIDFAAKFAEIDVLISALDDPWERDQERRRLVAELYELEMTDEEEDVLDDAWRRVEHSKAPWAADEYALAGRTILARYIITMAKGGERDTKWLADSAILYLSQQKLTRNPPDAI